MVPLPTSAAAFAVVGVNSGVDPAAQFLSVTTVVAAPVASVTVPSRVRPPRRELLDGENDLLQIGLGNPGNIGRHSVPPVVRSGTTPAQNVQDVAAGIRTLKRE